MSPDRQAFLHGLLRIMVHGVDAKRVGAQRGSQAGDQVLARQVTAKQQHLDQRAGSVAVAAGLARRRPPGVMHRGELPGRASLFQHRPARQRPRLA